MLDRNILIEQLTRAEILKDYLEYQKPMSKACQEFHAFTMIHVISSILCRSFKIVQGTDDIFANFMMAILAPSSRYKKSSSAGQYNKWLEWLELGQNYLGEIGSTEGLFDFLQRYDGIGYLFYDELGTLFAQGSKNYASGLIEYLMKLYSCDHVRQTFKQNSYYVPKPFLNLIGASQFESLKRYIKEEDLYTGILPRFMVVFSEYVREHIPRRPKPNAELQQRILNKLIKIKAICESQNETELILSDEAGETFDEWSFRNDARSEIADVRIQKMYERLEATVFKLCIVLQAAFGRISNTTIEKDVMENAIELADFTAEGYKIVVLEKIQFSKTGQKIEKLKELLLKWKTAPRFQLFQFTKFDKIEIEKIMEMFVESGLCREEAGARGGKVWILNEN